MSNKRKNRSQTPKFYCSHCQERLWRLGSPKYHLFYQDASEIKERLGITRTKASFLAANNSPYVDSNTWLEEFFCEEHGKLWMRVSKQENGAIVATPAKSSDWKCTTHTINPDIPNPSVSEFSYRMSRGTNRQLV
ncbi:MAG: hypothetical protein MUD14_23260 [Hydrococcus sp. Prado102]|jgi:hypothetical protein|nr:hypothetical protein [Hydrococcus sp. Prado102]